MLVTYEVFEQVRKENAIFNHERVNAHLVVQVMVRCDGVFGTWDDEYDKFTGQLREMSKKKREETLKFSWRANSAHKKLQDRIGRMKE